VAGKQFIGRDHIAVDVIAGDVDAPVAGVLNAINKDKRIGGDCADGCTDTRHVIGDAGNRRCVQDRRDPDIRCHQSGIGGGRDLPRGIIMGDADIGFACHARPMLCCTARGGVFNGRADNSASGGAHDGRADQTECQLCPAFADKELAAGRIKEHCHICLGLFDFRNKRVGGRVVTALIIGDRGKQSGGFNDRIQCQSTACVFKENARPLEGAAVDMREFSADCLREF
jgi:hypothetical protein